MICLKCENEEFVLKPDAVVEQEFRGETFNVVSPVMECTQCGWQSLAEGQMDELGRRTSDAYREKHNLLTSQQIKGFRTALNMSQQEFAAFLRVGVASVKRWENWQVQDPSSDELIRKELVATEVQGPIFPSVKTTCPVWPEPIQIRTPYINPGTAIQALQWQTSKGICIAGVIGAAVPHITMPDWPTQKEEPTSEDSIYGPDEQCTFGGPSPPEERDESRFSFPMPSSTTKVSEKKTIINRCN